MNGIRTYLIFSIIALSGLALLAVSQQLGSTDNQTAKAFLEEASGLFLISGILSILYKKFIDENQHGEIKQLLKIHNSLDESGFLEYHSKHNEYKFSDLINNSDSLTIVLNDGLGWIKLYAGDLRERFKKRNTTTTFYQIDPDSEFVLAISKKVSCSPDDYKKKLEAAKTELTKLHQEGNKGKLEIYRIKTFPTNSIFMTEDKLIITPYTMASTRGTVPVFVYSSAPDKGVSKVITEDLNNLKKYRTKIYP
jgi:hypothetical protein